MTRSTARLLATMLLLAAALAGAMVGYAQSLTVSVEAAQAPSGQTVDVPILIKGSPGFAAMHLELTYNPALLSVQEIEPGDLVTGEALTAFNTDEPGRVVISVAASEQIEGDGTLAVARFQVEGEGEQGQTSPLDLEYPKAWDESGFDLVVDVESGEFTVASNNMLLLLAAAACLLLLLFLLVVFLLIRRRRRRRAEPAPQPQQSQAPAATGQTPKFCGNCGQSLEPGKRFCIHCGQPVSG